MQKPVICTLCHSQLTHLLFHSQNTHGRHVLSNQETFDLYLCRDCGCMFLANLNVNDEYYDTYYQDDYYPGNNPNTLISRVLNVWEHLSRRRKEQIILQTISQTRKIRLLDVGCGDGSFLHSLDSSRIESFGLEINAEGVKRCHEKGLKVAQTDLLNFKTEQPFDVITLWHVLEHLHNPQEVLKKAYELLKDDGIVILATPNTGSLGFQWGKAEWFHLDSPRHLVLYNKQSIEYLTGHTGFENVKYYSEAYDYPLDLMWSLRHHLSKYLVYPIYPIFKLFDQETLTVILRKKL